MNKTPSENTQTAWIKLIKAQQMLIGDIEAKLKKAKLPPLAWYDVLLELSRDPKNGIRQYEIGERILLNKHNLSRLIDRLEKDGLLKREICNADGRGIVVGITKKGIALKRKIWPIYADAIQSLIAEALTDEQMGLLSELLSAVITNVNQVSISKQ
jgi:DNA-binding MarR family transcriptional regulator